MKPQATNADILGEADDPVVRALDLSAFTRGDMVNLILQRSDILVDSPQGQRPVKAWMGGDSGPILAEVDRLGEEIARRAAGQIHAEYRAMRAAVIETGPKRIADIGCGYAIWDLFAARDTGADLVLIDIEENERRHFGFAEEGAAYTSLAIAGEFLRRNGVAADRIALVNPNMTALEKVAPVDLAVSLISCGFHYPVDAYLGFFRDQLAPGGAVILDLRRGTAEEQLARLSGIGRVAGELASPPKARRVLLRRAG